jgi:hypothetical protein
MKSSNGISRFRGLAAAGLVVTLGACSSGPANQITTPASVANPVRSICLPGGQDSDTANVLMLDTLLEAKQDRLFEAMQRAASGGELYKALLYSRVITGMSGAGPEVWEARARIASALDFPHEAEQAHMRASAQGGAPAGKQKPVEEPLPSAHLASKSPSSLADWAASLEIVSGSDSAWGRSHAVVAIRDDVSGISAEGRGEPVRADHVLPNLFVLTDGSTFREKGPSGMGIALVALGALSAGLGGYTGTMSAVEQGQSVAAVGAGELSATKTVLTGGSFRRGIWKDERFETRSDKGKPSGERLAVGYPLVMPTASGQPFSETVPMRLIENGTKTPKLQIGSDAKKTEVASVEVSRLVPPLGLSSLELMVSPEELSTLRPELDASRLASFRARASVAAAAAERFRTDGPAALTIRAPHYAARVADGRCVDIVISESRWLVPEK